MKKGLTLVELSIVLVIVGLLIGGILAANSMIKTSRIVAQINQFNQFDIALTNFYNKFNCIPGDCALIFGTKPFPGNNNGFIEGNEPVGNSLYYEVLSYFPELSESGMISDSYRYLVNNYSRGVSFPRGKVGDGGIIITSDASKNIEYFYGMNRDYLGAGGIYAWFADEPVLAVPDAYALDTKLDDGLPSSGYVVASTGTTPSATDNYNPASGNVLELDTTDGVCITAGAPNTYYTGSSTQKACNLRVRAKF